MKNIKITINISLDEVEKPNETKKNSLDIELVGEIISMINRVKKIWNDAEYLPTYLANNGLISGIAISERPKPKLDKISTLVELKESLESYLNKLKDFEIFLSSFDLEREDVFYNELPLYEAELFWDKLLQILDKNKVGEKYIISIYDMNNGFIPGTNSLETAKELASFLAPAILYENTGGTKIKEIMSY